MLENELQKQIINAGRKAGWLIYHTFDSRRCTPGFPDLVMVKPPKVLFVELKTSKGKLTKEQENWLQSIADSNQIKACVWRPEDVKKAITFLTK